MKLKFGNIRNKSAFFKLSLVFIVLMLINCALTYSPYSAFHSGRVGAYSSSTVFFFNASYILLISLIVVFIINHRIYKNNVVYILCAIMVLTGLINGGIFRDTNSYILDFTTMLIVGTIAYDDRIQISNKGTKIECNKDIRELYRLFIVLAVLGVLLAIALEGKYGVITFQFSRLSRGEVTIWQLFSVPVVVTALILINRVNGKKTRIDLPILIIMWLIILSTANRTQVVILAVCLIIFWAEQRMSAKKILVFFIAMIVFFAVYPYISNFFLLGQTEINAETISTILTGRWGLWKYYWEIFLHNMMFGYGPISINETLRRTLGASSEIGILKTVTSYGIVFGIIEIYIIVKSMKNAIHIIKNHEYYSIFDNIMVYLFFTNVILVLQQHSRILNYSDFLFFYSAFYLFPKGKIWKKREEI